MAETEGDLEALDKAYVKSVELYITMSSRNEPQTYQQAIDSPEVDQWNAAMLDKYKLLQECGTWEMVPQPANCQIVGSKWVYCVKYDAEGNISHYMARLVTCGYSQVFGVNYTKTFAPVLALKPYNYCLVWLFSMTGKYVKLM